LSSETPRRDRTSILNCLIKKALERDRLFAWILQTSFSRNSITLGDLRAKIEITGINIHDTILYPLHGQLGWNEAASGSEILRLGDKSCFIGEPM